jgi:multiple sugar transport system substrate-binding protein
MPAPKRIARVLLLALALLAVPACARRADPRTPDGRLIVDYWEKWTGFEGDAMQAVIDDFNASQPRLFVRKLTVSDIEQKLMMAISGGNPPDLAGLWTFSVPAFAEKGALTPLDKPLRAAGITRAHYTPVFWDLCTAHGFTWALPTTPASLALHWNKRLFREAGLDPERPPASLAELDRFAERLTVVELVRDGRRVRVRFPELTPAEKAAKPFTLVQVGHLPQEPGWWLTLWGYWFGARLWDGAHTLTADTPEQRATLQWMAAYSAKYGVDNLRQFAASAGNPASPQNPFLAGQVAMVLQGEWMNNFIEKYAPGLEWGAAPFPAADPERRPNVTLVEADVIAIPRGARHPREAFAFLQYLSGQGPMEKLNLGQRKFSPLADASPDFVRRHPNPAIGVFIDLARSPNACYVPRLSMWSEYNEEMRVAMERALALKATPSEALAETQRRATWKFDRIMRRWTVVREKRLQEWSRNDPW